PGLTITGCGVILTSVGGSVARVTFGLPLALILPGYALTAALFPTRQIGVAERLTLTIGISLAGLALVGLGLNWTPWGLTVPSWTTSLGGLTLAATLLALMRRPPRPAERVIRPTAKIAAHHWAIAGVSGVVLILAFMVARGGALEQRGDGFTQLWMLPDSRPTANEVHIGITSQERSVVAYRLE